MRRSPKNNYAEHDAGFALAALLLNTLILVVIFTAFRLTLSLIADLRWLNGFANGGWIN
jgi:hypothetical protein